MNRHPLARLALAAALLLVQPISAKEIAGVTLPDEVTLEGADTPLPLNGAGIREKFFVDVYVGALYLVEKTRDAQAAIDAPGAKRILMHFVYKEVSKEKLVDGWHEGFKANTDRATLEAIKPRIEQFAALFRDARKGDEYALDYLPGEGTRVLFNGTLLGTIEGEDFTRSLLGIWLGDKPVTKDLKEGMLGRG